MGSAFYGFAFWVMGEVVYKSSMGWNKYILYMWHHVSKIRSHLFALPCVENTEPFFKLIGPVS